MRAMNIGKAAALALTVVWAAGCSTTNTTDTDTMGGDTAPATTTQAVSDSSMSGTSMADVKNLATVFYFDFDQTQVKPEAVAALRGHAKYLVANPSASVVLEGHADERGTREYNMALGERRAQAIARVLTVNGVSSSQIELVSFGEEKPVVMGHNESSWAQNRRVELKY
ncbi:peptidoglycan-associated lipoprotein Pal [uncultured Amphritea sp.]|uniref:peptidoglycan-associated lipoprotein Pal n=1 Tax=Amphritea sp. TaxID=1872502 RepID=UPI001DB8B40D|nr:peptidoglycan-associated lipoprotein Pal [uncultured Amphritea sp.]MBR9869221.1 peptidoglycan-associated lipoprotein Pal [Oceanospirillales bacterium]MBR9889403.1 peptidoglycan-associated lipoprotein Pal [Oceanospirillales bacterium]